MEIDGTYRLAVQTRVEQPLRILQLGALWKRQPHRVLEGVADADDAVVRPDGHPLGAGGLLPLHLFEYAGVGAPDQSPQLAQPLTPPAGHPADDVIYLSGRGCVAHADALLRLLSTQRTEGLSSLSLRWMQPSQQHGRRFPSSSSDCTRWMCWLLVSAFFGQSTQQIHSLRARGVRSCHAARTFGLAIRTRLRSSGTVSASRTSDRMISAAGRMSLTLLTETPAHSGAYSMSPSKSGGAVPIEYRIHSMRSPMVLERWPIDVPSPGLAPRGGQPAACHSAYVLFRSVR